jgi:hypothetical protein
MKKIRLFLFILLIVAVGGCSGIKVSQDYDLGKSLPVMKTYQWKTATQAGTGDVRIDNPLLDARIRKAVDRVFSEKGFQKVAAGTPDFKVAYQFSISKKIQSDDIRTGFGFGVGSHGRHGGVAVSTGSTVTQYDQGLLVIDLTDVESGDLLWRGNGTRHLPEHTDPEKREQSVNEVVEKILEQFPPDPE